MRKIQQICKCSEWIPGYVAHSENPKEEAITTEATFVLGGIDLTSKLLICESLYANAQSQLQREYDKGIRSAELQGDEHGGSG